MEETVQKEYAKQSTYPSPDATSISQSSSDRDLRATRSSRALIDSADCKPVEALPTGRSLMTGLVAWMNQVLFRAGGSGRLHRSCCEQER